MGQHLPLVVLKVLLQDRNELAMAIDQCANHCDRVSTHGAPRRIVVSSSVRLCATSLSPYGRGELAFVHKDSVRHGEDEVGVHRLSTVRSRISSTQSSFALR